MSQGVVPATVFLDKDDLETHELGHASLSKFIGPIISAGACSIFLTMLNKSVLFLSGPHRNLLSSACTV